ncbi:MAG: hypothetical protein Q4G68_07620 [Planctomycetia bacterium]|nr:hypothetical protein [Planctomycetia bacterium]
MKKKTKARPGQGLRPADEAAEPAQEPKDPSLAQWENYQRRRLAIKRQAVRRVRNTLIILAILAGLWFVYLCAKQ